MPARFSTGRSGCRAARGPASANQDSGSVVVVAVTVAMLVAVAMLVLVTAAVTGPGWRTVMLHVAGRHAIVVRRYREHRTRHVVHEHPRPVRARRREPVPFVRHKVDAVVV